MHLQGYLSYVKIAWDVRNFSAGNMMHGPVLFLRLSLSVALLTLRACTLIHLEGDGNAVTDIGGHSVKAAQPLTASSLTISQ